MLRLLRINLRKFSSDPPRRQNFFQLNPIFPDNGQKDFDIYNTDYNHIPVATLAYNEQQRGQKIKQKLTKQVYMNPVYQSIRKRDSQDRQIDEQYGFPIGLHQNFDTFIQIFKRQKKVGSNVIGQFQDLVMRLMSKFNAKSQIQLLKIFRLNLANIKKQSFKDKIRGLVINSAFIQHVKAMKDEGVDIGTLYLEDLQYFSQVQHQEVQRSSEVSRQQLRDIVTRRTLEQLDQKIKKAQDQIQAKAVSDGNYIPSFHPKFGQAIKEQTKTNLDYDLNFPRGHMSITSTNEQPSLAQDQDSYIKSRINKLFFTQALKQLQQKQQIQPQKMIQLHDIPLNIRQKDKVINSMLYKYKQYDLLVEPDLQDIYRQIDIVLKKIAVKVVPNYLDNQYQNKEGIVSDVSAVKERIISKDLLLWRSLDAEQIFQPDLYTEQEVNKEVVEEKSLAQISPSSVLQLSLNKMPFNLYRHSDLEQFEVFTKYKKKIYVDYLRDKIIDPELEFKFFSLDQAQSRLQKIKRPEELPDKFYGFATRKKSQAQVFVTKGNGKVMVNNEPLADYFGDVYHRGQALKPLIFTQTAGTWDLEFNVVGGGQHGQSQCMAMALTKALIMVNPKYQSILACFGLVGTDDRRNEPKRIGLYSARVRPPYVRR